MLRNKYIRGVFISLLALVLLYTGIPAYAMFDGGDDPMTLVEQVGWDPNLLEEEHFTFPFNGKDVTIERSTLYGKDYYLDNYKTTKQYLGIKESSGGGAAIAAVALAEWEACEEEVSKGIYNSRQERNGDNNVVYNSWFYGYPVSGDAWAWCAVFVNWCADQCGVLESYIPRTANCGTLFNRFCAMGFDYYFMSDCYPFGSGYTPVPGDIIIYGIGSNEHTGIVVDVSDTGITTVEGNWGNRVSKRTHSSSVAAKIIHVPYPVQEGADGMFQFLTGTLGFNAAVACGIMANAKAESGIEPDIDEIGGGGGYGYFQWTGPRKTDLINWCGSNGYDYHTGEGQLRYLEHEFQTTCAGVKSKLLTCDNSASGAYNAAYIFCTYYEMPADTAGQAAYRGRLAQNEFWPQYGN